MRAIIKKGDLKLANALTALAEKITCGAFKKRKNSYKRTIKLPQLCLTLVAQGVNGRLTRHILEALLPQG